MRRSAIHGQVPLSKDFMRVTVGRFGWYPARTVMAGGLPKVTQRDGASWVWIRWESGSYELVPLGNVQPLLQDNRRRRNRRTPLQGSIALEKRIRRDVRCKQVESEDEAEEEEGAEEEEEEVMKEEEDVEQEEEDAEVETEEGEELASDAGSISSLEQAGLADYLSAASTQSTGSQRCRSDWMGKLLASGAAKDHDDASLLSFRKRKVKSIPKKLVVSPEDDYDEQEGTENNTRMVLKPLKRKPPVAKTEKRTASKELFLNDASLPNENPVIRLEDPSTATDGSGSQDIGFLVNDDEPALDKEIIRMINDFEEQQANNPTTAANRDNHEDSAQTLDVANAPSTSDAQRSETAMSASAVQARPQQNVVTCAEQGSSVAVTFTAGVTGTEIEQAQTESAQSRQHVQNTYIPRQSAVVCEREIKNAAFRIQQQRQQFDNACSNSLRKINNENEIEKNALTDAQRKQSVESNCMKIAKGPTAGKGSIPKRPRVIKRIIHIMDSDDD